MCRQLGFEGLVEGKKSFFPGLLGRDIQGLDRRLLYGEDLPVVLLTGGPGMGKQRLLELLRDEFGRMVPVAYMDCADPRYEASAALRPICRSVATETMYDIALRMIEWEEGRAALCLRPGSSPV